MTAAQFRAIALSFPEAVEASHMRHPDFRVRGKIFATLGYPDHRYGVLKLAPEEQQKAIESNRAAFSVVTGAWGRQGATRVLLEEVKADALQVWMRRAWSRVAPKKLVESAT